MSSNILRNDEIVEIKQLQNKLNSLRVNFGVKNIGIFGSVIRGENNPTSDIDILVEFKEGEATFRNFMDLISCLENLFARKIDLVTTGGIDPYLRPYIENEVIWC